MAKKNGKAKKKTERFALVPDVPVSTDSRDADFEVYAISPPEVSRSGDLVTWLEEECAEWLEVIWDMAVADANREAIARLAFDLRCIVTEVAKCLRTGRMPRIKDYSASHGDALMFLEAAEEVLASEEVGSSSHGRTGLYLVGLANSIAKGQAATQPEEAA